MTTDRLQLSLTPAEADALFSHLIQTAPSPAQALAALNAVELMLGCHTESAAQQSEAYAAVRAQLSVRLEQQRGRLLEQQAEHLAVALKTLDRPAVARIHATLSRDAFFQVVARYCQHTTPETHHRHAHETWQWCQAAERRARAATPYPDAMDWAAAGIGLEEYLAMQDLGLALKRHVTQP